MPPDTGSTLTLKDKLAQDHPQFATTSIAKINLFPIPQWILRSGRNEQFDNWHRHALGMFAAWNINKQQIYETSPTLPATPQQPTREAKSTHDALVAQIWEEWRQINTAIYWHLVPSLVVQGVERTTDLEIIDSYVQGKYASGRALFGWAECSRSQMSPTTPTSFE